MAITCVQTPLALGSGAHEQVKVLQAKLGRLVVDGVFGPLTKTRVIEYQKSAGLYQDGIAGSITCGKLGIWCTSPILTTIGPVQKAIQDGSGMLFNNFTQFYKLVQTYCSYSHYFNGQYNSANAINMLVKDLKGAATGLNCVDYAQLGAKLAKEMGYSATIYGIYCTGDGINHAIFLIKGKEFTSSTWIDLAAAASSSYAIGRHWCNGALSKEPNWAPYE